MFLRFNASKVIPSGFAGGEYLPLPASKGPAFPFLLTLEGYPTFPADSAQKQRSHLEKSPETLEIGILTFRLRSLCNERLPLIEKVWWETPASEAERFRIYGNEIHYFKGRIDMHGERREGKKIEKETKGTV